MSNNFLLPALLLAHFIADFPLQTPALCAQKFSSTPHIKTKGLRRHALIHAITALFVTVHFLWSPFLPVLLILYTLSHYLLDQIKTRYDINQLGTFLLDQCIHITIILILAYTFVQKPAPWLNPFLSTLSSTVHFNLSGAEVLTRILASLILLTIGLWGAGIFLRIYIKRLKGNTNLEETGATDGGYLIGILERLLVITAIATNNAAWASLVLGVKSVARFRKFKDDAFVEYFLIGSFISFFVAVLTGFMIHRL